MSDGSYSRRQFLKIAGVAGATIGAAGGLGGVLAACGGTTATTTTAAAGATTTTAGGSSTTAATAGSTTTVSAGAQAGREIKIGFVAPLTGSLASFGVPDKYCAERASAASRRPASGTGSRASHDRTHARSTSPDSSRRGAEDAGQNRGKGERVNGSVGEQLFPTSPSLRLSLSSGLLVPVL